MGYWKNHPEAWPVEEIEIGGQTIDKEEAIEILETPPEGDARIILKHQLIAAKLNILKGADGIDVEDTIEDADKWLEKFEGKELKDKDRQEGIDLSETLDDYNNGVIGPGHCDDEELDTNPKSPEDPPSPTPTEEEEEKGPAPTATPTATSTDTPTATPTATRTTRPPRPTDTPTETPTRTTRPPRPTDTPTATPTPSE
jgi:hypothetical protein